MAKTLTYYKFHAQDQTLVIEPLFNMKSVLKDDVIDKSRLIREILWAGLDNQRPEVKKVTEHLAEMQRTAGYGKLLDDLTVGYRLTDGDNVFEVRTRPGNFINEFDKKDFSLNSFWNRLVEDALDKTQTFSVEATLTENEYRKEVAYPFHLTPEQLQACPVRVTKKTSYQPLHLEAGDKTHRVDVYTHHYSYALLDDDYQVIASVPVTVECRMVSDNADPELRVIHEKDKVCYEGGLPVGEADAIAGVLNMKVAKMLQGDEYYLLRQTEENALCYTNQLPQREFPSISQAVTYESSQGRKEIEMALIPKDLELESIRELLVAEAIRSIEKAVDGDFDALDREVLDPRDESPLNAVLRGLNVSVTDGENVFEASIPLLRDTARPDCATLCRYVSDELTVKDSCKVQNIISLDQKRNQEKTESLDVKSFRLK